MTRTIPRRGALVSAALAAVAVALAGCDTSSLLDVNEPDIIQPSNAQSTAGADALYNGAIGQFAYANAGNAGGNEGQILMSGLMADEWFLAGTFPTRLEVDERAINDKNATVETVFFLLAQAHSFLNHAAAALQEYDSTAQDKIGESLALSGFTDVYFAENYCEGVPLSSYTDSGTVSYGTPLTRAALLDTATAYFTAASTHATSSLILNLAAVGRARALLDAGDFSGAGAAVASVPTDFAYVNTHSVTTSNETNGVYYFNWLSKRWSISDNEGGVGLNYRSANDPRVQWEANGKGFDGNSSLFVLDKYGNGGDGREAPVPVADGVEARLIAAEAVLNAGNGAAMVDSLNALRADAANNGGFNLAPLTDPGTTDGRVDLLFRERAFWLFATGHRLGDMRRLVRQYGRSADAVFPSGAYFKGGDYGADVNIPVPFQETNNPNFAGCMNRDP
jgi:hypothetical protein